MEFVVIVAVVVAVVCAIRGAKALSEHARDKSADRGGPWLLAAAMCAVLAIGLDASESLVTETGHEELQREIDRQLPAPAFDAPTGPSGGSSLLRDKINEHTKRALDPYAP
jgi:hypothetical protein